MSLALSWLHSLPRALSAPRDCSHLYAPLGLSCRLPALSAALFWVSLACICAPTAAMQSNQDRDAFRIPVFDGVRAHFHQWTWLMLSYLMYKLPALVPHWKGTATEPPELTYADALADRLARVQIAGAGASSTAPEGPQTRSAAAGATSPGPVRPSTGPPADFLADRARRRARV